MDTEAPDSSEQKLVWIWMDIVWRNGGGGGNKTINSSQEQAPLESFCVARHSLHTVLVPA